MTKKHNISMASDEVRLDKHLLRRLDGFTSRGTPALKQLQDEADKFDRVVQEDTAYRAVEELKALALRARGRHARDVLIHHAELLERAADHQTVMWDDELDEFVGEYPPTGHRPIYKMRNTGKVLPFPKRGKFAGTRTKTSAEMKEALMRSRGEKPDVIARYLARHGAHKHPVFEKMADNNRQISIYQVPSKNEYFVVWSVAGSREALGPYNRAEARAVATQRMIEGGISPNKALSIMSKFGEYPDQEFVQNPKQRNCGCETNVSTRTNPTKNMRILSRHDRWQTAVMAAKKSSRSQGTVYVDSVTGGFTVSKEPWIVWKMSAPPHATHSREELFGRNWGETLVNSDGNVHGKTSKHKKRSANMSKNIEPGDIVRYTAKHRRSIGLYTGSIDGVVLEKHPSFDWVFVAWSEGHGAWTSDSNVEKVPATAGKRTSVTKGELTALRKQFKKKMAANPQLEANPRGSKAACVVGMRKHTGSRRDVTKACGKQAPTLAKAKEQFSALGVRARRLMR